MTEVTKKPLNKGKKFGKNKGPKATKAKTLTPKVVSYTAKELAQKNATVAPEGMRLSGPGTRSKNPRRYDANKHLSKNYKGA